MKSKLRNRIPGAELLEPRCVLSVNPVITEFVASNDTSLEDGFGEDSDWIEIHNPHDEVIDLDGFFLSDKQTDRAKWSFSESTLIQPGEYLIVFASGRNQKDPAGHWHTNFKLSASGEYLGLTDPRGAVVSQFGNANRDYPAQFTDVSFGRTVGQELVHRDSDIKFLIPTNREVDGVWFTQDFDADAASFRNGKAAIGYDDITTGDTQYRDFIETTVPSGTRSIYARSTFDLDQTDLPDLRLQLLYDDGSVVYLNGTQIFNDQNRRPTWSSFSIASREDTEVLAGTELDLSEHIPLLVEGENVLAFHLLNRNQTSSDLLLVPTLTTTDSEQVGYLSVPTPGAPNTSTQELGPSIRNVTHTEAVDGALVVTAEVDPTLARLQEDSVMLHYLAMYSPVSKLPMADDGRNGDVEANDGIYTARIPGGIAEAGEMIRWFVSAEDIAEREGRAPRFEFRRDSARYYGTVIPDPTASTDLPVMYWFVRSTGAAQTRAGTRASLWFNGEFYDNIAVDLHGQSTAGSSFPKKSFDFDANQGEKFKLSDDFPRVSDFNLLTNYGDQTKLRNSLGYGAHAASGGASHFTFPVSVHRNGEFFGLYDVVEQGDSEYLERIGRDPNGSLYKVNNSLNSTTVEVDKLTRKSEDRSDLQELVDATQLPSRDRRPWVFDHLDIADLVNYLAVQSLIGNRDFGHKNMYWYFDTEGSELWSVLPWDVDLSFGHQWNSTDRYFDETLFVTGGLEAGGSEFFQGFYDDSKLRSMYYRRLRTLMDEQLGAPGSPIVESLLYKHALSLERKIADEAAQDDDLWGRHLNFVQTPAQAAVELLDEFLPQRRSHLEANRSIPNGHGAIPEVEIGEIEDSPTSGIAAEQFIEITNDERHAVDISGWKLAGAISHTLKAGSVIPANDSLFLVADPTAFKSRSNGPRGGRRLVIQPLLSGVFDTSGGEVTLTNQAGSEIARKNFGSRVLGDTNLDGLVNTRDIDVLRTAIANSETDRLFDLNVDGAVDQGDFELLVHEILRVRPGDVNYDGEVNFADFLVLSHHFGQTDKDWEEGNFDLQSGVDFADFLALSSVFGS